MYFGAKIHRAFEAETRPAEIAGVSLRDPITARDQGIPILVRSVTVEAAFAERGYEAPLPGAAAEGCTFAPGLARRGEEEVVLLGITRWGRLAELPGKGIVMLSHDDAFALGAPGVCRPARRPLR